MPHASANYVCMKVSGRQSDTLSADGKATLSLTETGEFELDLMQNGSSMCRLMEELTLRCDSGYTAVGHTCQKKEPESSKFVAIGCAVLFVICLLSMLVCVFWPAPLSHGAESKGYSQVYVVKNPAKFRRLLKSLLANEVMLAIGFTGEVFGKNDNAITCGTLPNAFCCFRFLERCCHFLIRHSK